MVAIHMLTRPFKIDFLSQMEYILLLVLIFLNKVSLDTYIIYSPKDVLSYAGSLAVHTADPGSSEFKGKLYAVLASCS